MERWSDSQPGDPSRPPPGGDETRPTEAAAGPADGTGGIGRRLLGLARPHRALIARSFLFCVAMIGANLTIPYLFGLAVGDIEAKDESRILLFGGLILAAGAARGLFSSLLYNTTGRMGIQVEVDVRNRLYKHMLHLDGEFHTRQRAGELVSRLMVVSGPIRNFLSESVPELFEDVLGLVLTTGILVSLDPTLALVVLLPTPLVAWLALRFNRYGTALVEQRQHCLAAITGEAEEILHGAVPLKLLRAERLRLERFGRRLGEWYSVAHRDNTTTALYDSAIVCLPAFGRAVLLFWGGIAVIDARLSLATLVMFLGYLGSLLSPIQGISSTLASLQGAMASARRVFAVLDEAPSVTSRDGALEIPPLPRDLVVRDVSKHWGRNREGLTELQLAIAAGHNVAILGRAGSGKSALLRLLNRVYDPDVGEVQAGDARFTEIELKSLRRLILTVDNEPHLFPASLRENLLYGVADADEARMRAVAAALGLDSVVDKLPDGYDTRLGDAGEPLTVAEAQLVSLAQAVLARPGILLLDDATAPFAPAVERRVIEGLRALCQGITVVTVANRAALLDLVHEAIFLDRGKVVARGSPAHLLNECPPFRELLERWGEDAMSSPDEKASIHDEDEHVADSIRS